MIRVLYVIIKALFGKIDYITLNIKARIIFKICQLYVNI